MAQLTLLSPSTLHIPSSNRTRTIVVRPGASRLSTCPSQYPQIPGGGFPGQGRTRPATPPAHATPILLRNPDPEWLSQQAAADREPDSALRRCHSTIQILKKMTIYPQRGGINTGN